MTAYDPAALRHDYRRGALDEASVAADWLTQLRGWFDQAVAEAVPEPNALQLATADAAGRPALRTVLAKGIDERGVTFYTNYGSRKAADLDVNPRAAAQFLWLTLERQVRIEGTVSKVSAQETAEYFHSRPAGAQLGAWASPQSQVIDSRAILETRLADVESSYASGEIPVPPHWGGYLLAPDSVEFWQGRPDRMHDRLRFREDDGQWRLERLAP